MSESFETSAGTLYVSKPYRSKSSRKLRALITFAPRKSVFDISNESTYTNQFRGFFSLFWISIFIFTVQTYVRSIETNGRPLNLQFATMFSQDAITLALSDVVLVLSTCVCVPFATALKNNWIRYYWTGVVLQSIIQTTILVLAITWTFNRQWPWVQAGFLTLHSLVMIMKTHSYITVNGQLQYVRNHSESLLCKLKQATKPYGGLEAAITEGKAMAAKLAAEKEREQLEEYPSSATPPLSNSGSTGVATPILEGTPLIPEGSTATSYIDAKSAVDLRRRLAAVSKSRRKIAASALGDMSSTLNDGNEDENDESSRYKAAKPNNTEENEDLPPPSPFPYPLLNHPSPEVAALAQDYYELRSELVSTGPQHIKWPGNVTWKNYGVYLLIPSLVYELEYPTTDKIRIWYLMEKTVATFGTFALLYTVTESFILPYTPTEDQSFLRSLLDLALPFMIAYLLLFYIIFECICNGFAELSYFADRQFYEDWVRVSLTSLPLFIRWNSTSWDEFSRKWNKPVHAFLLRHVYAATIMSYKISNTTAMLLTFLLSAAAHELVMMVVTHKIRVYLFTLQLIQIPLIVVSRLPTIKRNKLLGNVVFWLGLYAGFPLLCVAYVAH